MTVCYDCGLDYGGDGWIEALIPDYIWYLIRPKGAKGKGGLLCISCICKRIRKLGLDKVPCFICGTEPIIVLPTDGVEFIDFIVKNWKPKNAETKERYWGGLRHRS